MHLQFYHLNRAPFQLSIDPEFFWERQSFVKALDVLKDSLEHHGGLSLLTGDAGSGKSIMARAQLTSLGKTVRAAVIPDSSLTVQEFYDLVAHEFKLPGAIENRQDFHDHIRVLLQDAGGKQQQVLLVVDEAQQLTPELIEEIDGLLNLHPVDSGGLSIYLIAQTDTMRDMLAHISRAFKNHVLARYHLSPFSLEETTEYIRHRLHVVGAEHEVFNDEAIGEVHRYSGGYPGQINIICDLALFTGYTENAPVINAAIIRTSAKKLQFSDVLGRSKNNVAAIASLPGHHNEADAVSLRGENEKSPATEDVVEPVLSTAIGGRSFALPAVAGLTALVLMGGGYFYYTQHTDNTKSIDTRLVAEPTPTAQPTLTDTPSPSAPMPVEEEGSVDTFGYPPPAEEIHARKQPVDDHGATAVATVSEAGPARDSVRGNGVDAIQEEIAIKPSPLQDRLEVKALQVEESISSIPVAEEGVGDLQSGQSVASVAASSSLVQHVESTEVIESLEVAEAEAADVEVGAMQEMVPAVEPEAQSITATDSEVKEVVFSSADTVAAPSSGTQQQAAADTDTLLATARQQAEKASAPVINSKAEENDFVEAEPIASKTPSSPKQETKTTEPSRLAAAPSKKQQQQAKSQQQKNSTAEPDPEDVIDWLLKKKGLHAQ